MGGRKSQSVALAVLALALTGAEGPVKIEFQGWFSNPVFSADGSKLIFARLETLPQGARTAPSQIVVWDVKGGKEARRLDGPADDSLLGPIALAPDGKRLAIGMWNTAVRLWDIEAGKEIARFDKSQGAQHLQFAGDGRNIAWVRNDEVYVTADGTAKQLQQFGKAPNTRTTNLALVDDGKTLLSGQLQSTDANVPGAGKNRALQHTILYRVRDAATGKEIRQLGDTVTEMRRLLEGPPVHDLFVCADGKTVILAGGRGNIQVCDWTTGKKTAEIPAPWKAAEDPIRRLTLSADGKVAAVVSAGGVITVWDLAAGKELRRVETGQSIDHVALAPDGKRLAVCHQTPGRVGAVLLVYP
jgi:WD40 repeat protein